MVSYFEHNKRERGEIICNRIAGDYKRRFDDFIGIYREFLALSQNFVSILISTR